MLERAAAPVAETAVLSWQRWEIETRLDDLKTHQRGSRVVLRSKQLGEVEPEMCGHLCVHHAVRRMVHHAALGAAPAPERLSVLRRLRAV